MTNESIKFIKQFMSDLEIPYAFLEWRDPIPNAYFIGTYTETPGYTLDECGQLDSTFIIRGFTRDAYTKLEQCKQLIKDALPITGILSNGNGIAVSYDQGNPVPTYDAELKSIQINLNIKEWTVNN